MTIIEHDSDLTAGADLDEDTRQLPGHLSRITMDDGKVYVVRISNREYIAWDMTAPRKKWGTAQEAPFLATSFMAWAAAKREGKEPGRLSFDVFRERAEQVKDVDDSEDLTGPTQPEATPGSS